MGLWNALKQGATKVVGWTGNALRKVGEFGGNLAKKVAENAMPIATGIANIVGNNPLGNTIRNVGQGVANFAKNTGIGVAKGIADVGRSLAGGGGGG